MWVEGFRLGLDGVQDTGLGTPLYTLEDGVWMHYGAVVTIHTTNKHPYLLEGVQVHSPDRDFGF